MTEKFFQDPAIEFPTPAFSKKKGYTTYDEMMVFLNDLKKDHPQTLSIEFIGKSQKGKDIPMVILKQMDDREKIRIWLQGGLHGNEPGSTESMLFLIHNLLKTDSLSLMLGKMDFAIVPMANIDGMEKDDRYAANGLDLNRDQTKLMLPETVWLKNAFFKFDPHVALDFHEYRPFRRDYVRLSNFGVCPPYDVMFLYSGNLNVPSNLRSFIKNEFVSEATQILEHHGYRHHDYFTSTKVRDDIQFNMGSHNARSSASSFALSNTVASLIEVRGVGIGKTSYKRRVFCAYLVAYSYLNSAAEKEEDLMRVLAESEIIQSEAIVRAKRKKYDSELKMIDVETNEIIELQAIINDAWQSEAVLKRDRPTAYLLMPEQAHLTEKLNTLGLELYQLKAPATLSVEQFKVTKYLKNAEKYEGVNMQEADTEISKTVKEFPVGTWVLMMDQEGSGLAVETLEPEAPNSFVSFSQLETNLDDVLPVFRFMGQKENLNLTSEK